MKRAELEARITELETENRRLRLQLFLATDPASCAHEWQVRSTSLRVNGEYPTTYHIYETCIRCYAERDRHVTREWMREYDRLRFSPPA